MSHHLPRGITYTTIGILAFVINLVEIILILRKRHLISTFEIFLLSLAVADCICGVTLATQNVLFLITGTFENIVLDGFTVFSLTSSITNLLAISLHRLLAVKFPLRHHLWITKERLHGTIALIWIVSIALTTAVVILSIFGEKQSSSFLANIKFGFCVKILISSTTFLFVYGYIIAITFKQSKISNTKKQAESRRDKVLKACTLAVSAFIICSCPWAINYLITRSKETYTAYLLFGNILIDPSVYFFKGYLERNAKERQRPGSPSSYTITQNSTL